MCETLLRAAAAMLLACVATAQESYSHGPDSERHNGVPRGKVSHHVFRSEGVFAGTIREYWVYVPAQYDGSTDAALMVFQDGHAYVSEDGAPALDCPAVANIDNNSRRFRVVTSTRAWWRHLAGGVVACRCDKDRRCSSDLR